jgi:hypothetical protein
MLDGAGAANQAHPGPWVGLANLLASPHRDGTAGVYHQLVVPKSPFMFRQALWIWLAEFPAESA